MADPRARLLALDGLDPLIERGRLQWRALAEAPPGADLVLLGLVDGVPHFVAVPDRAGNAATGRPPHIFGLLAQLPRDEMALYGAARAMVEWHGRHRFCPACAGTTSAFKGGWGRQCGGCGAQHFPRTDPVVIMLAEHDGAVLLGRGLGWPEGRYSALAGFVEPGESIEEAVARELLEESGVRAFDVRYVASQPWPFPSQLMIGCHCISEGRALDIDTSELADLIWATRDEVVAALAGDADARFIAPPPFAIARDLLEWWVAG
ncbi:NAD(+) diphosphatase [Sphingomonas baiyangensis]|uniref:NAD(+) diphosphatase n=2 Tax=Sphingomonas baiyangensis TaxID=2572576 RepID=A0A4U1LAK0_9SPHN|nr:NAD(+) diphosphatase [Sphingomonas baiyangensis]